MKPRNKYNLILRTYNIQNLHISYPSIARLNCNIIIHNDNPDVHLNKEYLDSICTTTNMIYIINETQNVGMFQSTINSVLHVDLNIPYTIILDDDDIFLGFPKYTQYCALQTRCKKYIICDIGDMRDYYTNNYKKSRVVELHNYLASIFETKFLYEYCRELQNFIKKLNIDGYINANEDCIFCKLMKMYYEHTGNTKPLLQNIYDIVLLYNQTQNNSIKYPKLKSDCMYNNNNSNINSLINEYLKMRKKLIKDFEQYLKR